MAGPWTGAFRLPSAFLDWWLTELQGLVPRFLLPATKVSGPGLTLHLTGDEIILSKRTGRRGVTELARITDGDALDQEIAAGVEALPDLAVRGNRKLPILVRLASTFGMRRVVELPLAAKDDLQQFLQFELDRLTPFRADDVCFAWRIDETDSKTGRMKVALDMAPKAIVSRAIGLARAHDRDIDRIELERAHPDDEPLDLLPRDQEDKSAGNWFNHLLKIVTLLLLVTAIALPIRKQMKFIDELEAEVMSVRSQAEESLVLREKLAFMSKEASFLADSRNALPTMTETIAELTRLVPDDAHILQLRIHKGTIDLNGVAEKASSLLAILDSSPVLASPRFKSPVIKDQRSGKERFQISVELTRGPS